MSDEVQGNVSKASATGFQLDSYGPKTWFNYSTMAPSRGGYHQRHVVVQEYVIATYTTTQGEGYKEPAYWVSGVTDGDGIPLPEAAPVAAAPAPAAAPALAAAPAPAAAPPLAAAPAPAALPGLVAAPAPVGAPEIQHPLVQAAQAAPAARSRRPMDQEPGQFGYKDMSIAVENALNNATRITVAFVEKGDYGEDVDFDDLIMRSASRFLDWHGDRMRDEIWGDAPVTRDPVDDGPPSGMPEDDAPPPESQE